MNKLKFILPVAFLVFGGVAVKALGSRDRAPKKKPATERSVAVRTAAVERRDAPFVVHAEGTVKAVQNTALSAQVAGRVTRLSPKLKTGGRFTKGELLLQIDDRDYRARLVQAQAQVQALRQNARAPRRPAQGRHTPAQRLGPTPIPQEVLEAAAPQAIRPEAALVGVRALTN